MYTINSNLLIPRDKYAITSDHSNDLITMYWTLEFNEAFRSLNVLSAPPRRLVATPRSEWHCSTPLLLRTDSFVVGSYCKPKRKPQRPTLRLLTIEQPPTSSGSRILPTSTQRTSQRFRTNCRLRVTVNIDRSSDRSMTRNRRHDRHRHTVIQ